MKNSNYKNWFKAGCLGLTVMVGLAACSDDHFDVQNYGSESGNGASGTIMSKIESNKNLSDFAAILKRVTVKRDETDKKAKFTYAELLATPQAFTVWAPVNGSFDAAGWNAQLDEADSLRTLGDSTSIVNAVKKEYTVESQFVKNHIARFNFENNPNLQNVRMLNSKIYAYDAAQNLFNGVELDSTAALVAANNGVVHLLTEASPYLYNIFDYMGAKGMDFDSVYNYISRLDTREFDENLSIPGAMNENGEMVYVDSVYTNNNVLLASCGASIKEEDSLYYAVIPTNVGFKDAIDKIMGYLKFADVYAQNWSNEDSKFTSTGDNGFKIGDEEAIRNYADSIARQKIITSMFFSMTKFGLDKNQKDELLSVAREQDSLISTNGVVFYEPGEMFVGEPLVASNGFIFKSDSYIVDPQTSFLTKSDFSGNQNVVALSKMKQTEILLNEDNRNKDVKGYIRNNSYTRFEASGNRAYVDFRLPNVFSGKYKISIELVPSDTRITEFKDSMDLGGFNAKIVYDDNTEETCEVFNEDKNKMEDKVFNIVPDTVMTYTLWDAYEFKRCYVGLPSTVQTFARLRLYIPRKMNASKSINVVRIFIEPAKEESNESVE